MKKICVTIALVLLFWKSQSQVLSVCLNKVDSTNTGSYTGNNVKNICVIDFNGDALADMASVSNNNVSIQFGLGSGVFSAVTNYTLSALDLSSVASADFNNDGFTDLVVVDNPSSQFTLLLGSLNGVFTPTTNTSVGLAISSVIADDFNNDNQTDIAISDAGSSNVYVFLGNGNSGFSLPITCVVGQNPVQLCSGDFNNDGKTDIVTANVTSNTMSLLLGNGNGGFSAASSFTTGTNPSDIVAWDFNSDGNMDAATVNSSSNNVTVLLGNGSGGFSSTNSYLVGMNPSDIAIGDFNNDGKTDLVTSNQSSNNISILSGSNAGIFSLAGNYAAGAYPYLLASLDDDMNGYTDLVVINIGFSSNVMYFSNVSAPLHITGGGAICLGSSATLTATGGSGYIWSTGLASSSLSIQPTSSVTYTVSSTGVCGISTQTVAVTVNQNCQDVWPGDANSDGIVDNTDVLEFGLHFTQTGPARATTSNAWQSYFANNWTGTISNGKNVNHSDCNGDGVIDSNDTLAIFNNYGLTHTFKQPEQTVVNPALSIVPDQSVVAKGNWGTASVFLGEASAPVTNINGLAFTVTFDQNLIDVNSFYIEYPTSFINATNQNLKFQKPDFANGKLYTATTHTITNNVSGNGKIAVLHYKIKSNLATDEVLNIGITQVKQSDANGALTPLTAGAATVAAIGASVGMDELSNGNMIGVYPNPANSSVTIHSNSMLGKIELLSVTGQLIIGEMASGNRHQIDLMEVANGVYFVIVYGTDQKVTRKKIVVQH